MKKLILLLLIPIFFSVHEIVAQNAPVSTIGTVESYSTTAVVPITVTGFTAIGSCEFILNFDPSVISITSVSLGPGVTSYYFLQSEISPGVYKVTWLFFQVNVQGLNLTDGSVFMNINVQKVAAGYSPITYDNSLAQNCFYTDWEYNNLNDIPKSTYFIDGSVTFLTSSNWTGAVNADWSTAGNWSDGVPNSWSDATIPDVSPNPFPVINAAADCYYLLIDASASVTVQTDGALTTHNNFVNNGQFTIKSSSFGDGSFIENGSISGTGNFSVERYLTSERWHYISPSVSDALSGMFLNIYLNSWDEPTGTFNYIVDQNVALNPMQGYGCWASDAYTGTTTVSYTGSLNTGAQYALGLTNTASALHNSKGFNFVGNPYTSAIDWDATTGWIKGNLDDAVYIWNPTAGQYGSYINGLSQNGVSNIIPSGQGFFVHVSTGNPTGLIQVNNNARLHSNVPFFKNSDVTSESNALVNLQISSLMNTYFDQCIVHFDELASEDFDVDMDAYKMHQGLEEAPNIYFKSADQIDLSINSLPPSDDDEVIPLYCTVGTDGIYDIDAMQIANCESKYIYLKDLKEDVVINLKEQATYSFYAEVGDNNERFKLMFLNSALDVNDVKANLSNQIYADKNTVHIVSGSQDIHGVVDVYDVAGQLVYSEELNTGRDYQFKLNVKEGIYLVKLNSNHSVSTKKVYITD